MNPIYRARELRSVLGEARPRILVVPKSFRDFGYAGLAGKVFELRETGGETATLDLLNTAAGI